MALSKCLKIQNLAKLIANKNSLSTKVRTGGRKNLFRKANIAVGLFLCLFACGSPGTSSEDESILVQAKADVSKAESSLWSAFEKYAYVCDGEEVLNFQYGRPASDGFGNYLRHYQFSNLKFSILENEVDAADKLNGVTSSGWLMFGEDTAVRRRTREHHGWSDWSDWRLMEQSDPEFESGHFVELRDGRWDYSAPGARAVIGEQFLQDLISEKGLVNARAGMCADGVTKYLATEADPSLGQSAEARPQTIYTLRRGVSAPIDTIDPHRSSAGWEGILINDLFVGLVQSDQDGSIVPGVAESWTTSPSGLVWTFKLRDDATWSDGTPLTANDFVYAFRRLQNPAIASINSSLLYMIENAKQVNEGAAAPQSLGVRAPDNRTLEVRLNAPTPHLLEILTHSASFPIPAHTVDQYSNNWTAPNNLVVNGPYKLVYWVTGDRMVAERNPQYWGSTELCYDQIIYSESLSENQAVERMSSGSIDTIFGLDGISASQISQRFPEWIKFAREPWSTFLSFNHEFAPFNDSRVRNALAMAIDRQEIVNDALLPGNLPAASFVPPRISNYVPDRPSFEWAGRRHSERLNQAKALLEDAGFGPQNPLEFEYLYRSTGQNPSVAQIIQSHWSSIAPWVLVEATRVDAAVMYARLRQNDFELSGSSWLANHDDATEFLDLLAAEGFLRSNYLNQRFTALLDQASKQSDLKTRARILAEAEQLILDDAAVIPLWFHQTPILISPDLAGWNDNSKSPIESRWLCPTTISK